MATNNIHQIPEYLIIDVLHIKDVQRFFSKIQVDKNTGCWTWTAYRNRLGYGKVAWKGEATTIHRIMYAWLVAPLPRGFAARKTAQLDHLCKNRACCNPTHLELVTQKTNILRSTAPSAGYARRAHCSKGHEFTPENTYKSKKGERICRTCQLERGRLNYQRNREHVLARTSANQRRNRDRYNANQRRRRAKQKLLKGLSTFRAS